MSALQGSEIMYWSMLSGETAGTVFDIIAELDSIYGTTEISITHVYTHHYDLVCEAIAETGVSRIGYDYAQALKSMHASLSQ